MTCNRYTNIYTIFNDFVFYSKEYLNHNYRIKYKTENVVILFLQKSFFEKSNMKLTIALLRT